MFEAIFPEAVNSMEENDGWEKVGFRGRKAVIRGFEAAIADVEEDDRAAWLKREAPALYRAARASAPATAT